jgi:ubiquinol-cytochrome c reductase iron-sulfur subunit
MWKTIDLWRVLGRAASNSYLGYEAKVLSRAGLHSSTEHAPSRKHVLLSFGDAARRCTWQKTGFSLPDGKGSSLNRLRILHLRAELGSHFERNTNSGPADGRRLGCAVSLSTSSDSVAPLKGESAISKGLPQSTALPVGYADEYFREPHLLPRGDPTKRAFTYMMLGSAKLVAASAVRVLILKFIYTMSASADVLALGTVEVDLAAIPLGQTATIKWRGKPVMIRHRTPEDIEAARRDDGAALRDPEADASRVLNPEWLVVIGVCTHLGCVPIANAGDWGGFFCPCHGSHYDVSGRVRKGPAPLNLEVPKYTFTEEGKLIIG